MNGFTASLLLVGLELLLILGNAGCSKKGASTKHRAEKQEFVASGPPSARPRRLVYPRHRPELSSHVCPWRVALHAGWR
jgi:hypothetical protein